MIPLVLLVALWVQIPTTTSQDKTQAQQAAPAASSQNEKQDKGSTVGAQNTPTPEKESDDDSEDRSNCFDRNLHRAYESATILGVIGGIIGLYFIWKQSVHTERAAKSAKESSDAALLNAKAIINSERPWVFHKIRKKVKWIDSVQKDELGRKVQRRAVYFTFSITNHGRTPAEIIAIRGNPSLTRKGIDGGFTDPPDYGTEYIFRQVRMIGPDQRWDYDDLDLDFRWADEETLKELEAFRMHRILKGVILYRDVFDPKTIHESRFCYTYFWAREMYLPSGPPDHTKYT